MFEGMKFKLEFSFTEKTPGASLTLTKLVNFSCKSILLISFSLFLLDDAK